MDSTVRLVTWIKSFDALMWKSTFSTIPELLLWYGGSDGTTWFVFMNISYVVGVDKGMALFRILHGTRKANIRKDFMCSGESSEQMFGILCWTCPMLSQPIHGVTHPYILTGSYANIRAYQLKLCPHNIYPTVCWIGNIMNVWPCAHANCALKGNRLNTSCR